MSDEPSSSSGGGNAGAVILNGMSWIFIYLLIHMNLKPFVVYALVPYSLLASLALIIIWRAVWAYWARRKNPEWDDSRVADSVRLSTLMLMIALLIVTFITIRP